MAGPIENMENIYKKTFKYTPPSPPANLIDCSNLTIDFTARKLLNIGLDPTDEFKTAVHIITASRYLNIPVNFLERIFRLMGNILSFILDRPEKYKRQLFLETESISMSSMIYQSENTLVLESKTQDGCRVLLNRTDLLLLQDLEAAIFEIIKRKSTIVKPIVLHHIELIATYLQINVPLQNSALEILRTRVRNIDNSYIQRHVIDEAIQYGISQGDYVYTNQVKLYATDCIVQKWMEKVKKDEEYNSRRSIGISAPSFSSLYEQGNLALMSPFSPPIPGSLVEIKQHSPPAQGSLVENNQHSLSTDDYPIEHLQYSLSTQESCINIQDAIAMAVDENDGPMYFNRDLTPLFDYTDGKSSSSSSSKPSDLCPPKFY